MSRWPPTIWTGPQRRVVWGFAVLLIVYVLLLRWSRPMTVPDPQPAVGVRAAELQDRVDPNTADVATLAAVPTLGAKRAAEIILYREQHPGEVAFASPRDLLKLKGFGVSTLENVEPYLMFAATGPSSASRKTSNHESHE